MAFGGLNRAVTGRPLSTRAAWRRRSSLASEGKEQAIRRRARALREDPAVRRKLVKARRVLAAQIELDRFAAWRLIELERRGADLDERRFALIRFLDAEPLFGGAFVAATTRRLAAIEASRAALRFEQAAQPRSSCGARAHAPRSRYVEDLEKASSAVGAAAAWRGDRGLSASRRKPPASSMDHLEANFTAGEAACQSIRPRISCLTSPEPPIRANLWPRWRDCRGSAQRGPSHAASPA